jgi:hypothetical protein
MSKRVATPGEISHWRESLSPLPQNRLDAVLRLLSEVVAECPACEEPVRRCDPRRVIEDRLVHLACAPLAEPITGGHQEPSA